VNLSRGKLFRPNLRAVRIDSDPDVLGGIDTRKDSALVGAFRIEKTSILESECRERFGFNIIAAQAGGEEAGFIRS
jgi:hypothetical protein